MCIYICVYIYVYIYTYEMYQYQILYVSYIHPRRSCEITMLRRGDLSAPLLPSPRTTLLVLSDPNPSK